MTYTPPEQPAQQPGQPAGYQPAGYQPAGYQSAGYQSAQGADQGYGNYAAAASTSKKLSMWGLILGISSIIIPIWINAIAGAVLSGIGLAKEPQGKTMAIWGLVTSVLGFIWAFIFWPLIITVIFAAAVSAEYGY
ncbi:hypothetical protein [Agrococcus sp. Ld7]|uniref:hypothetical protein n=1 Tax=Agrococcus sp. Ld7 TaxID=649148 RepID=UPI00386F1E73